VGAARVHQWLSVAAGRVAHGPSLRASSRWFTAGQKLPDAWNIK
jgi:hypothetical protein